MGVNLELSGGSEGDRVTDFTTNGGYRAFREWVESLPAGRFPAPRRLVEDGEYAPTEDLAAQLEAAFAEFPPAETGTRNVADRLLDRLGGGYPEEKATITT